DSRSYSVTKRGNLLQVEIENKPKLLVVAMGQDGTFTGPATSDISGHIIVGYHSVWVEQRRVSDNSVVVGSGHEERTPIYADKTERCGFASLRATARVEAPVSVLGAIGTLVGAQADPASARAGTEKAPAGPRISGTYAGGGLKLEFQ